MISRRKAARAPGPKTRAKPARRKKTEVDAVLGSIIAQRKERARRLRALESRRPARRVEPEIEERDRRDLFELRRKMAVEESRLRHRRRDRPDDDANAEAQLELPFAGPDVPF